MKVLVNRVFGWMLKFLVVQRISLDFRYLNKQEISLFETLHNFKSCGGFRLKSWLDILLGNLFLCYGHCAYRQCIGIPVGANCAVYLANFYLFSYELDFLEHLLKNKTWSIVLHRLSLVCRFVDDLFIPNFPEFESFMYLDKDSFGGGIYPKMSCDLNCTSNGFSCNF
jgi:hypothetical protein